MKMMNKFPLRQLAIVTMLAVLFAACKKNDDIPQPAVPVAGLMAFNLAPDQAAVGFALSGSNLGNTALGYNNFTGAYLPVYTGTRELRSFNYNSGNTLAIAGGNFADSMYYSAFLIGANGNYRNVVVQDHLDSLPIAAGKAYLRYVNAIADSSAVPSVVVTAGENTLTENAAYGAVSAFKAVNAGQVTVAVSGDSNIAASRVIALEENKVYTVLLAGIPGAADTSRAVQVKFITNGTITP